MGHADRAGFSGYSTNDWAEEHVEDSAPDRAMTRVLEQASNALDLEAADDELDAELYEDDLLSLIQHRPSRHARHI